MTKLEKEIFQCHKQDFLSFLVLPFLKISPETIGKEYLKTYLTFSGKIVIAASTVRDNFKFWLHEEYQLSFRELDKIYIVFNHPKQYEESIISIMMGKYSTLPKSTLDHIKLYGGMPHNFPVYGGGKYTHPILSALLKDFSIKEKLKKAGLDYRGEFLPELNLYEDLIDLDTVIL